MTPDPILDKLIALTKSITNFSQAIQIIQTFRKQISYNWITSFNPEIREKILTVTWSTLFELAKSENATIYINICSTIGALIFSISPFLPHVLMKSFSAAVLEIKTTSYASIAIISAFLNIIHSISPADIDQFISDTPVLLHFGVDVGNFVRHLPKLIPLMEPLDVQFHQQLLLSLVISCSKMPTTYHVESICLLLSLAPTELIPTLKNIILRNKMTQCLLALGPKIFHNKQIFDLFSEDDLSIFSSVALDVISNQSSSLTDFENACNTLSALTEYCTGSFLENLYQSIQKAKLPEYPPHFFRFLILISSDFNELKLLEDDKVSVKCAKIQALTKHLKKNSKENENKYVLDMTLNLLSLKNNEITTNLINMINQCFFKLYSFDKDKVSLILNKLMKKNKSFTWVQNCELVKLIETIGTDIGHQLIPNFDKLVISKLLLFSFTKYKELSSSSINCLSNLVGYDNINLVIEFLNNVNLFDEFDVEILLSIVNKIFKKFPNYLFEFYAPIVVDSISFYDSPTIAGKGFKFLRLASYYSIPTSLFDECIDWIVRLYKSMTQRASLVRSPLRKPDLPLLTSNLETDIVSSSIIEAKSQLSPLKNILFYFMSVPTVDSRIVTLMEENLRLFPKMILSKAIDCLQIIPNSFSQVVADILNSTSSFKTAAICAEFLCFSGMEYRLMTVNTIKFLMNHEKANLGALIFSYYRLLNFANIEEANELLENCRKRLGIIALTTLDAKLCISNPDEFNAFAAKTEYNHWPINDSDFSHMFESNSFIATIDTVKQYDGIDDDHWRFIFQHKDRFNLVNFEECKKLHYYKLLQFINLKGERQYTHNSVSQKTKLSLVQYLIDNEFFFNIPLALSFFRFSNYKISQDIFDKYFREVVKTNNSDLIYYAIEYATKQHLEIDKSLLIEYKVYNINSESNKELILTLLSIFSSSDIPYDDNLSINDISLNCYDKNILIISLHFDQYMNKFLKNIENLNDVDTENQAKKYFSTKLFVKMAFLISEMKYSKSIVLKYVNYVTKVFHQWKESKKLISFLRLFTNLSMRTASSELINLLTPLFSSENAAVLNELSQLLYVVLANIESTPEIYQLSKQYSEMSHIISPFMKVVSLISAFNDDPSQNISNITKNQIGSQFDNELKIPSVTLNGFRLMKTLIQDRSSAFKLFYESCDYLFESLISLNNKPVFDEISEEIMHILINRSEIDAYDTYFKPKIINYIFCSYPNLPCLHSHIRLIKEFQYKIPSPSHQYQTFMHSFVTSQIPDPNLFEILGNFSKWAISKCYIDKNFGILAVKLADRFITYFPFLQIMDIFAELLKLPSISINDAIYQIWRVYKNGTPLINVLLLLHLFIKQCNQEEIKQCNEMIISLGEQENDRRLLNLMHLIISHQPLDALNLL